MSRSYKKHPIAKDYHGSKPKKQANRKVRRLAKDISTELFNGRHYKSFTESWDIHDQRWRKSEHQAMREWEQDFAMGLAYCTREEAINTWRKDYKNK